MIETLPHKNMLCLLRWLEEQSRDKILLKYMEAGNVAQMTGSEFFARVNACAAYLHRRDLSGRHIGIMGANRWQWLAYLCAIFRIGAVAVLLSPDLNGREVAERAAQTELDAIVFDETLRNAAEGAAGAELISMDDALPGGELPGDFLPDPGAEELACILFTSGTTAACKAVMLSQRAAVAGICHNVIGFPFEAQLAVLPMHHIAGFASVLNTWYLGRILCLGQDFKDMFRYLKVMRPDYTLTVPSILQVILRKLRNAGPNGEKLGWNLHLIGCGGAQFPPEVIQSLNAQNIRVLQSYGATEAGGLGFDWEMTPQCRNTMGKPCPEIETKIVDGELYLRSASVMSGYYKDPKATAEVLKDGWYATGDLVEQDADGYLYLKGRKKNLIILANGENVSPEEIEARLYETGLVEEVMVGLQKGLITATVFLKPAAAAQAMEAAVDAYNSRVPQYKQVQELVFLQEPFAKTEVGKMIRNSVTGVNRV